MIKNPEVLRMAGHLLDRADRRCVKALARDRDGYDTGTLSPRACQWSLDGAVLAACHKLDVHWLEARADLATLFGTYNYASHWDRSLPCPRWTQDEMVEKLKSV